MCSVLVMTKCNHEHFCLMAIQQITPGSRLSEGVFGDDWWLMPTAGMGSNCQNRPLDGDKVLEMGQFPPIWIQMDISVDQVFIVSLTHWGRVMHICVSKLTIIGSENGLSPRRGQAIIWTNAGILLIGPLGTNSSDILIGIQSFSFRKMHLKISSAK